MNKLLSPVWYSGMFMLPQHFQLWDKYYRCTQKYTNESYGSGPGFLHLNIDEDALMCGIYRIDYCVLRWSDGSWTKISSDNGDCVEISIDINNIINNNIGIYLCRTRNENINVPVNECFDGVNINTSSFELVECMIPDEMDNQHVAKLYCKRPNVKLHLGVTPPSNVIDFLQLSEIKYVLNSDDNVTCGNLDKSKINKANYKLDNTFTPVWLNVNNSCVIKKWARNLVTELDQMCMRLEKNNANLKDLNINRYKLFLRDKIYKSVKNSNSTALYDNWLEIICLIADLLQQHDNNSFQFRSQDEICGSGIHLYEIYTSIIKKLKHDVKPELIQQVVAEEDGYYSINCNLWREMSNNTNINIYFSCDSCEENGFEAWLQRVVVAPESVLEITLLHACKTCVIKKVENIKNARENVSYWQITLSKADLEKLKTENLKLFSLLPNSVDWKCELSEV